MIAIIQQGGKQYMVKKGQVIKVEKIEGEVGFSFPIETVKGIVFEDSSVSYDSGSVTAEILDQKRGEKLVIFKRRRRKNSRRKNGHRQYISVLKIQDINF